MTLRAPGLPALIGDLHDLARRVGDTDAPDREASSLVAAAVAARAPRFTGYLANSVTASGAVVEVLARYAPFVNARHPFLGPGADAATPAVAEVYTEHTDHAAADSIRPRY